MPSNHTTTVSRKSGSRPLAADPPATRRGRPHGESEMKKAGTPGVALFVVGIVFLAIGSSGRPGLLGVGAAFIVIGLVFLIRQRRGGSA